MTRLSLTIALAMTFMLVGTARAQNLTVQQPVLQQFSVGTTVSVPDRGRALLGSVSRAGNSSKQYGPFPSGTNTGQFREHSSVTSSVFIHDLRAMDEYLLQQKIRSNTIPRGPALTARAEMAYRSLVNRHQSGQPSRRVAATSPRPTSREEATSGGNPTEAERFYQLGLIAEEKGRQSLARLHFRGAAQHGSQRAKARLSGNLIAKP